MTIKRIVELELFIEREMKGNEALTNDAGCAARAKIDRDILACLKELKVHREAWEKVTGIISKWKDGVGGVIVAKDAFSDILDLITDFRPKEGESNDSSNN